MNLQDNRAILLVFISFFLSFFYSCNENKNKDEAKKYPNSTEKNDSISNWIKLSLDPELNPTQKKILLSKAFLELKKYPDDSLKMKKLSKISYYSINTQDSIFFRNINSETVKLSQKLNDSVAQAEAKWDLGIHFNNTNEKDSAYYCYNQAISLYNKIKKIKKVAYLLYDIGIIQRETGDYSSAESSTIKAIDIFKSLDQKQMLAMSYNSLGAITNSLGNYQEAINFYKKAESYLENLKNSTTLESEIINNIGVSYRELGDFKKAEEHFKKVLATDSLKINQPTFYAKTLTNLANTKLDQKTTQNLEPLYQEAILIQKHANNEFSEATSTGYYANYLSYRKDTIAAISYAQKAKVLAEDSKNSQSLLRILDLLTKIDPKNATAYAQEYFTLNTKLQDEERQLRDKFARVRFQTDEFIERNELLAKQNTLLTREKQLWVALAGIALLGILAILIIVIQRIKNKNLRFEQQQQEANQEIFNLLMNQQKKLTEGKKIAQERIAQELHDGVLNDILGIRLILSHFNKKNDEASISYRAELIEQLAAVSEDIRTVSHELDHKSHQKVYNFIESIKTLIEKFKTATHTIKYEFTYPKNFDWDATNVDIKINLYRILQESIQNAIKHAQPKNIFINFDALENTIRATIEDDGNGFDTKKLKKGIGVKNIASRLKKLNGEWKIESTLGKGTSTIIKIPLENSKVP